MDDAPGGVQEASRGEEGEEEVVKGAGCEDDGNECVQCGNKTETDGCHEEPV